MVRKVKLKNMSKKQQKDLIIEQRRDARIEMLLETSYALAWALRCNNNRFGKTRIERHLLEFFEMLSDIKIGGLLTFDDIDMQLKKECEIDVKNMVLQHAQRHYYRNKAKEEKQKREELKKK